MTAPNRLLRRRLAVYAAVVGIIGVSWYALTATQIVKPILLAAPGEVWNALEGLAQDPVAVLEPLQTTLLETTAAFALAALVALPLGLLIGSSRLFANAYEPILTSVNAMPLVVLYPAIAAIVGIGPTSKVLLGGLYAFFPIAIASLRAAATVDHRLVMAARSMGASRSQLISSVMLPAIASPVIGSMRVAAGLALVTIIAAEFISGSEGVGYELGAASQGLDTPTLFAWVAIACGLTIAVNVIFTVLTNTLQKGVTR